MLTTSYFSFNSTAKPNTVTIDEQTVVNVCGLECTGEDIMNAFIDSAILKDELNELKNQINRGGE